MKDFNPSFPFITFVIAKRLSGVVAIFIVIFIKNELKFKKLRVYLADFSFKSFFKSTIRKEHYPYWGLFKGN